MKKSIFMIAVLGLMTFAACGNKSGNNGENGETSFATDTLVFSKFKWFDWTALVPQGKGYQFTEERPAALAEVTGANLCYLVGGKAVIIVNDFESKTLDEWKATAEKNWIKKEVEGLVETKVAGRAALRYPTFQGDGTDLKKYGYVYYIDFKDFSEAGLGGYNSFTISIYPADGQPEKIDEMIDDEEVKFILDNMVITPKND